MKYNLDRQARNAAAAAAAKPNTAQEVQAARKKYSRAIDALARSINQYRIDVQRFFAGDLKLPPDDLRESIHTELRRLQNSKLATSGDFFRLNTLEAQLNSHAELFGRRLREREQGGVRRGSQRPEHEHDAERGIAFGARPAEGAVEALYKSLYLRDGNRNTSMDLERFRTHISQQVDTLRAKTGADQIQFRVAEEDGKLKIKAKPIRNQG